ncbi:MAG: PKD domain-containing protein [Chitinophagaceae bacterium]
MKKTLLTASCLLLALATTFAAHIIGGEMRYTYVGPGAAPNTKIYRITMLLFRGDDPAGAPLDASYIIAIYNNDNGQKVKGPVGSTGDNWRINRETPIPLPSIPIVLPSCIQGAPTLNYTYASYTMTTDPLPDNQNGYTVVFQTCCRLNGLMNVANSTGSTYNCSIPGTNQLGSDHDNSPQFGIPINVICKKAPFTLNFGATDPDPNDSLVYSFCNAFNGGASVNSGFDNPAAPPYGSANYLNTFSGANPLGTSATIDPKTGIITGIAPVKGKYVICVCIDVYRDGKLIATHRKDLIVDVSDCEVTVANPMPDFVSCGNDFNVQFSHSSSGATSVFWDFGVAGVLNDTADVDSPVFTYPDTGVYKATFIINKGKNCSDTAERIIKVYPGFFPGFEVTGSCFTNPFRFTDTTKARYGVVDSWSWNFGDLSTLADTSHLQNPAWTYPDPGPRQVTLIATSTKGCIATKQETITITDKPPLSVAFKDTLICATDLVQLHAIGSGAFSWTPVTAITGANSASPTVQPLTTTWYHVELNDHGCLNHDSVQVRVTDKVTITPMPATTICRTDSIQLQITTNGLNYQWTPVTTLNNPAIEDPIATPTDPVTTYTVTATVGSCIDTKTITITTVPYPVAIASDDTTICYNTPVILHGSHDGSSFAWSPTASLLNANTLNPTAFPPRTMEYVLTSWDTRGCPKPGRDTILVTVLPKIRPFAGFDTTVVIFQPVQLHAEGGVAYVWTPATGLSNPGIQNPIGTYGPETDSIRYIVQVFNEAGCFDTASVKITVFKTNPYVFVPTAFTPNGDGLNDEVKPVAAGIQKINYFRIFNRWGQLVFSTTRNGHGWDGKIKGEPQGTNVFVWMVSAIDYLGKPIFLKGTVTLIR